MNAKEAIEKIKTLLSSDEKKSEEKKTELAQMKLEDGTVIEAEAFEPGAGVFIVSEEDRVALPIGEYALEDGKILVVEEEGVIKEIKEAAAEEEAAAAEEEGKPEEEEMKAEFATVDEFKELKATVEKIAGILETLSAEEEKPEETKTEETKTEMSSEDKSEGVKHSPEKEEKPRFEFNAPKQKNSTLSRIFNQINK